MIYHKATSKDIDTLVKIRKKQLIDEGIKPAINIDKELFDFFHTKINDGSLVEWVVEDGEEIVATAAIIFYQFPPTYTNKTGWKGYITNMYTSDTYRKRGIATTLLEKLVAEAKSRNIKKLWLGASYLGRPVYERFGFKDTGEWLDMTIEAVSDDNEESNL